MSERRIHKYALSDEHITHLSMPVGARVISTGEMLGTICVWAIVDPKSAMERRSFDVIATGEPFDDCLNRQFVGTVTFGGGLLVAHVFEVKP